MPYDVAVNITLPAHYAGTILQATILDSAGNVSANLLDINNNPISSTQAGFLVLGPGLWAWRGTFNTGFTGEVIFTNVSNGDILTASIVADDTLSTVLTDIVENAVDAAMAPVNAEVQQIVQSTVTTVMDAAATTIQNAVSTDITQSMAAALTTLEQDLSADIADIPTELSTLVSNLLTTGETNIENIVSNVVQAGEAQLNALVQASQITINNMIQQGVAQLNAIVQANQTKIAELLEALPLNIESTVQASETTIINAVNTRCVGAAPRAPSPLKTMILPIQGRQAALPRIMGRPLRGMPAVKNQVKHSLLPVVAQTPYLMPVPEPRRVLTPWED